MGVEEPPRADGAPEAVSAAGPAASRVRLGWLGRAQVSGAVVVAAALWQLLLGCLGSLFSRHSVNAITSLRLLDSVPTVGFLSSLTVLVGLAPLLASAMPAGGPQLSDRRQRQILLLGLVTASFFAGLQILNIANLDASTTGVVGSASDVRWANGMRALSGLGPLALSGVVIALASDRLRDGRGPASLRTSIVGALAGMALSAAFLIALAVVAQSQPTRATTPPPFRNSFPVGAPAPVRVEPPSVVPTSPIRLSTPIP